MSEFSAKDREFMQRSLQLAEQGMFGAHPNPMVGCVLVKDDEIVGEGWHACAGEAHAEVNAIGDAGDKARGATAYVTLEPCAHHGKTPPCCDALIEAGIAQVLIAHQDPNPKVDGKGIERLQAAGLTVRSGLMRQEAQQLMAGFLSRVERGRPRVQLKIACSLDGRTAMANGESQWITGVEARADVQRLRARAGAIMTGIGTVLADDPSLTVREEILNPHDRQPLRVVLDSDLRMSAAARMLSLPGETIVFCSSAASAPGLTNAGAEVVSVSGRDGLLDLALVLQELANRGVNDLLVEAGPTIAGQLVEQNLVDEFVIYQAPHILGSETMGMFSTPSWKELTDRQSLVITDVAQVGNDTRITAVRKN
jgi:diaminohydroxyphosphoribosylaminopyrimidine deaminase/5-amino-6-(5-phosphoribosylamino)uracil reductase